MKPHGPTQASAWTRALALSPLVLAIVPLRHLVEGSMWLQVLVQLPWLAASGWAWSRLFERRHGRHCAMDALDAQGLLGMTVASCVFAFWMVPPALDWAVLAEPMRWDQAWTGVGLTTIGMLMGVAAVYRLSTPQLFRSDHQAVNGSNGPKSSL